MKDGFRSWVKDQANCLGTILCSVAGARNDGHTLRQSDSTCAHTAAAFIVMQVLIVATTDLYLPAMPREGLVMPVKPDKECQKPTGLEREAWRAPSPAQRPQH